MVSAALQGFLSACGIHTQLAEFEIWAGLNIYEHTALKLLDGRLLDLTADQFNPLGYDLPQSYLGVVPEHYRAKKMLTI